MKATELLEKKLYFKLSTKETLQLKMHKSMCEACSSYQKQSILIDKAIAKQEDLENQQVEIDVDSL